MAKKRKGNKDDSKGQKKKKMEIDCSKNDQIMIEEIFERFPTLSEGIFGRLDNRSLASCREVSKAWKEYVDIQRIYWIRKILMYATNPLRWSWSSLSYYHYDSPHNRFHGEWKIILDKTPIEFLKKFARFVWLAPRTESSPLYVAGAIGDIELFQCIKEKTGLKEDSKNSLGETPLTVAACNNHVNLCKVIIEELQNKNPGCNKGATPLHHAASNGHFNVCELIMERLLDKNPGSNRGTTPLHHAARKGHLKVCQLIIDKVANISPKTNKGNTPLHLAAREGHHKICQILLKKMQGKYPGPDPGNNKGLTPLHFAAHSGHYDICNLIMDVVDEEMPRDDKDNTPLHYAASNGFINICQLICEKINGNGLRLRSKSMIEVHGMNPENEDGYTPLHLATEFGHFEVFKFLFLNVKDKNPRDNEYVTPLHLAAKFGRFDICEFIYLNLELEDKNPTSYMGITPLHFAATNGHFDVCKLLCLNFLENRKNPMDDYRRTPIDNAYSNKHWKILYFLIAQNNLHCS